MAPAAKLLLSPLVTDVPSLDAPSGEGAGDAEATGSFPDLLPYFRDTGLFPGKLPSPLISPQLLF